MKFLVNVTFGNCTKIFYLIILEGANRALLGRDIFIQFNLTLQGIKVHVLKANGKYFRFNTNYKILLMNIWKISIISTIKWWSESWAWSTPYGMYKINRLPFGTKPACALFQNIVEKVLVGCSGCVNYMDDVVTGRNVNFGKWQFFQNSIYFCRPKIFKEWTWNRHKESSCNCKFTLTRRCRRISLLSTNG